MGMSLCYLMWQLRSPVIRNFPETLLMKVTFKVQMTHAVRSLTAGEGETEDKSQGLFTPDAVCCGAWCSRTAHCLALSQCRQCGEL